MSTPASTEEIATAGEAGTQVRSARPTIVPQNPGRPWRILVVDDNADIVAVISRILSSQGYETMTAREGKDALEIARRTRPDVVLLDWMLPGMDGLEVCRALKSDAATRGIMVVMVTGRGSVDNRIEGFDSGADDFIPKPFNHSELLARLRSALRIKKLTDELCERNRQLLESQNELVRAEKMSTIGLLASGIAHEFNNIMAGISGYAQLARRHAKYVPQLIEVALTQAERAEELTNSLSAYHRQSAAATGCDVKEVILRAFCLVKKLIESNGIVLRLDAEPVPPASISPGQLQEVVLNMLLNSIHAVEPRGEISVTVGRGTPPGEIVIAIRDTGVGIAKENIGKIFDPFFTTKGPLGGGKGHGTGLGLTVCYNIVQSRGGKIAVESEVGKGTTFTVTLPAHDGPLPRRDEAPGNAPVAAGAAGVRRRLLVVDDEEPVREMLREYLCEHDVHCCASGEEAVTAYRTRPFDYVVLDLCMENSQSGVETLHELKAIDPEARVILASGRLPEDIPAAALALAHGHLLKPFQLDALAALLGIRPA